MLIHFPDPSRLPASIVVDDESYRYRGIMKNPEVTLKFTISQYVKFPAGCWIEYQGQTYFTLKEGSFKKLSRRDFEYTVLFEQHGGKLRMWTLRNYATDEFKFSAAYTDEKERTQHLQLL